MSKRKPAKDTPRSTGPLKPKGTPVAESTKKKTVTGSVSKSAIRWTAALIFLLGFVLYFQTYKYDFALDDRLLVFDNELTKQGISAIPEIFSKPYLYGSIAPDDKIYRPTSKAVFAVCWSVSNGDASLFHMVNVLLYALTGMLLFLALVKFFPGNIWLPLIISLLFVAHPVHTEVVCNIKSLDEILKLLFFIASVHALHAYLQNGKWYALLLTALGFFFSFLSKESGITFLAVYPLLAFFVTKDTSKFLKISGATIFAAILVFAIRIPVLDSQGFGVATRVLDSDNILAGTDNVLIQKATAIYLLGKYVLLLFFPHPLVCDYSASQLVLVNAGNPFFILSFLGLTALVIFAFARLGKKDWLAFGIIFFFITISATSNIFFIGGSHFAERFLYTPSLGFCIAIGVLADRYINPGISQPLSFSAMIKARPVLTALIALLVSAYSVKIFYQNTVWKNNLTLFEHGVKASPKSYRMHLSLAQDLIDPKHIEQFPGEIQAKIYDRALNEARVSLQYYHDIDAYDIMGNIFYMKEKYDSALYYYLQGLKVVPDYEVLNHHAGKALNKMARYREAISYLHKALEKNPKSDLILYGLALSHTNMNDIDKGLEYFLKVLEINPNKTEALHYTAEIYKAKGDMVKYEEYKQKENALGGMKMP